MDTAASFFDLDVIADHVPLLIAGLLMTVSLAVIVVLLGLGLGVVLAGIRGLRIRPINWLIVLFANVFRAVPPLVILIVLYLGLPYAGVQLGGFVAGWLALGLALAASAEEICWAGFLSVDRGQWEAARSTGLGRMHTLRCIVVPQAARNIAPELTAVTLETVKAIPIAGLVALPELLRSARAAQDISGNPTPLIAAAVIYFVMLWPVVRLLSRFERRTIAARRGISGGAPRP